MNTPVFLVRKTEKLTSALYRVTDLIPEGEPLKRHIRESALSLLEDVLSFIDEHREIPPSVFNKVVFKISKITSLLEVSFMGSFVSQMNFSILRDEYIALRGTVVDFKQRRHSPIQLNILPQDLRKEYERLPGAGEDRDLFIKDISKGQENNVSDRKYIGQKDKMSYRTISKRQNEEYKGHNQKNKERTPHLNHTGRKRDVEEKGKRRAIIMDFIKQNGESSIKDITSLPQLAEHYSEKTIQRELVDMVTNGVLKKHGERRWSRYYI